MLNIQDAAQSFGVRLHRSAILFTAVRKSNTGERKFHVVAGCVHVGKKSGKSNRQHEGVLMLPILYWLTLYADLGLVDRFAPVRDNQKINSNGQPSSFEPTLAFVRCDWFVYLLSPIDVVHQKVGI